MISVWVKHTSMWMYYSTVYVMLLSSLLSVSKGVSHES